MSGTSVFVEKSQIFVQFVLLLFCLFDILQKMEKFFTQTIEQTFEKVNSSVEGLSHSEAKKRLEKNGKNLLAQKKRKSAFVKFLEQFKDVLILVLIASCIVSVIIGAVEGSYSEFIDAGIILFVVLFNAIIGFMQERKSEKAMEALKNMTKPFCKVLRNGRSCSIKSEDLVVGDIVILEAGDIVPADLRLIETNSLKIEESALTGESLAIEKDAATVLGEDAVLGDRTNMAFMSSVCTYGRGLGVVVAVGMDTEMGKIASALAEMDAPVTPLTKKIKKTSLMITSIVLAACLAVFIVQICTGNSVFSAFSMAIAIAVCAVPEGLPACNTVTMSMGVKRMSDARAIVKSLPAVETLGSTEVICSDKTGTLTLNKMTVTKVFFFDQACDSLNGKQKEEFVEGSAVENVLTLDEVEKENELSDNRNFTELLRCMLLCNDTKVRFEDDKLESIGDPTEIALVHYGYKMGLNKQNLDGEFKRLNEIPFDSDRKLMTTFNSVDGKIVAYTKGAVDNILGRCNRVLDNGKIRRLTNADRERILAKNGEFASAALRNLAFAAKYVDKIGKPTSQNTEFGLCFLGLVGMIDPPREEVKDAIKTCKKAGITTIMITGDHKDTAFAIAKELGICDRESEVITGKELDQIDDEEFCKLVEKFRVYARVSPEHKVRIVKALKKNDKIVAMTGDGVNDAPSIKAADIGVGMGITGTDVTKEAADMILTDDNFATIVGAVKEGRRIYDTLLKILMFLLGTSIAELILLTIIMIALPKPGADWHFFTPALLLWTNFVSDTFVGLALGFEKASKHVMDRRPIKNTGSLFRGDPGVNILCSSIFVTALLLVEYCVMTYVLKYNPTIVTTFCFLTLVFAELCHSYNLKHQTQSLFTSNPFDNKWLNIAFLGSALLTIAIVVLPLGSIQTAMGVCQLNWWQCLIAIGGGFLIIPYFEIVKIFIRASLKRNNYGKKS